MTQPRNLIIVAAGAFGREVLWVAREARQDWNVLGFLDDSDAMQSMSVCDLPVLGKIDDWSRFDADFIIAIGTPRSKKAVHDRMISRGSPRWATLIHRSVQMSQFVSIGEGSVICANCSLTTQITLGRHVIVNLNCTIGHDAVLGDFTTLAPLVAMSGNVRTGGGVEIGTGAALLQGAVLGEGSMVGMGAVVTKDVAANALVVGFPAQLRRELAPFTAVAAI